MYIIEGNQRKIQEVWQHIKRRHTGEKIAVVGFPKRMPENYLRNKQITFYESLTIKARWLQQAEAFLEKFQETYDGVIFYVDCTPVEAEELKQIVASFPVAVTVTVATETPIKISHHPLKRAA